MRLDKFLSAVGVGTRKEVKKLLKSGAVTVNGDCALARPERQIDERRDEICVNGKRMMYREFIYLMMNKPAGYVSATRDGRLPTVLDLVAEEYLHFDPFPAGRLDRDTEGLLILTNDGALSHRLLSPARHIPKTYVARLDGPVGEREIRAFADGVALGDGVRARSAALTPLPPEEGAFAAQVVLTEGKFHQVKRMFAAVGREVLSLRRTQMNRLPLDKTLAPGESRELTERELELLKHE